MVEHKVAVSGDVAVVDVAGIVMSATGNALALIVVEGKMEFVV